MCRVRALVLVVFAGLTLAACGTGDPGGTGAAGGTGDAGHNEHAAEGSVHDPVDDAPSVTITAVDIDFEPDSLQLQAGEPTNVTVVNEGEALHDFTLEEANVHANVEPGDEVTTSVTVDEPGTYEAICTVAGHADAGMVVEVTVAE